MNAAKGVLMKTPSKVLLRSPVKRALVRDFHTQGLFALSSSSLPSLQRHLVVDQCNNCQQQQRRRRQRQDHCHLKQQRRLSTFNYKNNPFSVLGIPDGSSFEHVKQRFVELALKKHPDVEGGSAEDFIKLRTAFEAIIEREKKSKKVMEEEYNERCYTKDTVRTATSVQYTGSASSFDFDFDPDNWQSWFRRRTGIDLSFEMSESTRREVINAYKTLASGGKDKGGYWELARQLAEHEDIVDRRSARRASSSSLLLTSSSSTNDSDAPRRRRRKR
ncbi:hypothetical protein ACA910_012048 [Epithemia clementina (nom. ined.)]